MVLALGLVALAACDDDPVSPFGLYLAAARWERSNIDSYEVTLRRLCFCESSDPVRVTVSRGAIVGRVNVATGEPVPQRSAELYPDVPGLFAIVADALEEADHVEVDFDRTYGFPSVISIDWKMNYADDEIAYRVENFAPGIVESHSRHESRMTDYR